MMSLLLAVTMYNEVAHGDHVSFQLDNALKMSIYDDIVVLDDGSDDGTWDVLTSYARIFNNIHVYRSDLNSILGGTENRKKTISEIIRKNFNPTWVNNRAADIVYPIKYAQNIKSIIESQPPNVCYASLPFIHLWRSVGWYRVDGFWGESAHNPYTMPVFWRFNKNFTWDTEDSKPGFHSGKNIPSNLGFETLGCISLVECNPLPNFGMIHYGMSSHRKLEEKFKWSMKAAEHADKIGFSIGMPPVKLMPTVAHWPRFNGYRTFHEFQIRLNRVNPDWFEEDVSTLPKPKIESLYELIKEYRPDRAHEYKETFDIIFREQ